MLKPGEIYTHLNETVAIIDYLPQTNELIVVAECCDNRAADLKTVELLPVKINNYFSGAPYNCTAPAYDYLAKDVGAVIRRWLFSTPSEDASHRKIWDLASNFTGLNREERVGAMIAVRSLCATEAERQCFDNAICSGYNRQYYDAYSHALDMLSSSVVEKKSAETADSRQLKCSWDREYIATASVAPALAAVAEDNNIHPTNKKGKKIMANTNTKNSKIISHVKQGAQVGLADEAGTVIVEFINQTSGGKLTPYMASEEGTALVKLVAATLLIHGIDFISDDPATRANVETGCGLVIEAASRDFLQPRMAELRKVGLNLAKIGTKARALSGQNS